MPIYEYRCLSCGHQFEKIVKLDAPNPPCVTTVSTDDPKILVRCDGQTERLISRSSFHLKGAGWAKDGYDKNYVYSHPEARGADNSRWNVEGD